MADIARADYRAGLPDSYDPAKGLKKAAVAKAAEEHFRRAKDATQLYVAVETKLGEQRRFVLWWEGQEKRRGLPPSASSDGGQFRPGESTEGLAASDFGLDRDTIYRWSKRLKDPAKFDAALESAHERCVKVCEARSGHSDFSRATFAGENEWYTPAELIEAARAVMGGIDLDPASNAVAQETVRAGIYYTKENDGLEQEWHGRVWLNPPYAHPHIVDFVEKLVAEVEAERVTAAILLTNSATDTGWFHTAARAASAICFTRGRLKFVNPRRPDEVAAPPQGQAFFYFGEDVDGFAAGFNRFGFIAELLTNA